MIEFAGLVLGADAAAARELADLSPLLDDDTRAQYIEAGAEKLRLQLDAAEATAPTDLSIPRVLDHTRADFEAPQRFKLLRWGRRRGKTRLVFRCALAGHGPADAQGQRQWRGMDRGGRGVWIVPIREQSTAIWTEEILPRFAGVPGIKLNESERWVQVPGGGRLYVISAEAIDNIRGWSLDFAILDEAAHMDLEYCWHAVVWYCLLDRGGWAIFSSTTNAGRDGNAARVTPSYFNRLCTLHANTSRAGEVGYPGSALDPTEWHHSWGETRDNPLLPVREVAALYAGAPPGDPRGDQELRALLLTTATGVVFHEWQPAVHVRAFDPPADWPLYAGLDWGYNPDPGHVIVAARGPREWYVLWELAFNGANAKKRVTPQELGILLALAWRHGTGALRGRALDVRAIGVDGSMYQDKDGEDSIGAKFQAGLALGYRNLTVPAVIAGRRGPGVRIAQIQEVHELLSVPTLDDGTTPPWARPRLRVSPACTVLALTLQNLPLDDSGSGDCDTRSPLDHAWDALRYLLSTAGAAPPPPTPRREEGRHPGFRVSADGIGMVRADAPGADLHELADLGRWSRERLRRVQDDALSDYETD